MVADQMWDEPMNIQYAVLKGEPHILWADLPCDQSKLLPARTCFDDQVQEKVLSSWECVPWVLQQVTSTKPWSVAVPGSEIYKHCLLERRAPR